MSDQEKSPWEKVLNEITDRYLLLSVRLGVL